MKRLALAVAVAAVLVGGVVVASSSPAPVSDLEYVIAEAGDNYYAIVRDNALSCNGTELRVANGRAVLDPGTIVFVPPSCRIPATTTVPPTTTTTPVTTTTVPPTTTTEPPTTTAPTTTTPVQGAQFVETFTGNTGLDRFDSGVWHRDPYLIATTQWAGDHDMNCGAPDTQRTIRRSNPADSFYLCRDHLMTSVGDTSGYSIAWFSPRQTFESVRSVSFDVNLTDLGTRQWWKVGVVSETQYNSTVQSCCGTAPGFLASDVAAAELPQSLATSRLFVATWGGGISGGYPGGLKIGNTPTGVFVNPTSSDKMTRHPASLTDNGDGTITFTVAGVSTTARGSFPSGPVRVVFYDHNYTPDKSIEETGVPPQGHTWHWDNIIVT